MRRRVKIEIVVALGLLIAWGLYALFMHNQETRAMNGQRVTVGGVEYEFTSDATRIDDWWMVQLKEVNR